MSASQIVLLSLLILVFLLNLLVYQSFFPKKKEDKDAVLDIAFNGMLIALIIILCFVPNLGYIQVIPGVSFTLIHLPVLIGAYIGGPKKGLLLGFAFGISSWINAVISPVGFNALFVNPLCAIPSRMLFGFLSGLVFSLIRKLNKRGVKGIYFSLASVLLTVCHTVLVFLFLFFVHPAEITALLTSSEPAAAGLRITTLALIAIGMAGEAALAGITVPLVGAALGKAMPRLLEKRR